MRSDFPCRLFSAPICPRPFSPPALWRRDCCLPLSSLAGEEVATLWLRRLSSRKRDSRRGKNKGGKRELFPSEEEGNKKRGKGEGGLRIAFVLIRPPPSGVGCEAVAQLSPLKKQWQEKGKGGNRSTHFLCVRSQSSRDSPLTSGGSKQAISVQERKGAVVSQGRAVLSKGLPLYFQDPALRQVSW